MTSALVTFKDSEKMASKFSWKLNEKEGNTSRENRVLRKSSLEKKIMKNHHDENLS